MSDAAFVADALRSTAAELFSGDDRLVPFTTFLDLGWSELVNDDLGVAVSVLAEEQGRRLGVSRLVELAMSAAAPSLFDPDASALVFAVGAGSAMFPEGSPIDGLVLADGREAARFVVPTGTTGFVELPELAARDAEVSRVAGIDPDARATRVRGHPTATASAASPDHWERAVAVGRLAVAHELLGVVDAMLDLAVVHVRERHQFGAAIGSFQAVQHRLADVRVDAGAARAVCATAWIDPERFICAAARSAAGRAFETANRHCQQVLGAMGSTWEHGLHRYQRRGLLLSQLLDPAATLREALSTVVIDQRRVEVLEG